MFGRLLWVTGTVLVIAVAFVTPVLATSTPASAAGAPGSWQIEQTYASGFGSLEDISCSSAADCTAVGAFGSGIHGASIVATTDGGSTWTAQSFPLDVTALYGVSCPSASVCTAVGSGAAATTLTTTNGGATWTENNGTGVHDLGGVSCPSVSDCTAVGFTQLPLAAIVATTDGGVTWTFQPAGSGTVSATLYDVSCPSTSDCTAVGQTAGTSAPAPVMFATSNAGATWTAQSLPVAAGALSGISCPSVSNCTAVGSAGILGTTDGGTVWNIETPPVNAGGSVYSVSCPSTSDCIATGSTATSPPTAVIFATTNAGATWTTEDAPSGVEDLGRISCPAVGACQAVGQDTSGDAVIIGQGPTTFVALPSNGATVTGDSWLDAGASSPVGIASVTYELSGGSLTGPQTISGSTPTLYGYIGAWNSTSVPNGTYTLQSVATDTDGVSTASAPITISVNNPVSSTAVIIPSNGATQSGTTALLDATSTADVTAVSYELSGGTLTNQVIATGGATIYGWLAEWNTTSVPNGTYTLQSVGTVAGGGTVTSAPITITVSN